MKRKNKLFIFAICIALIFYGFLSVNAQILNKETISSRFILGENMGFDLTPGELNFGKLIPDYKTNRNLTVSNTFDKNIIISIESSGEISDYLIVSENNFELIPNESREIVFTVYTSGLTEYREYKGKIIIISKKV